MTYEEKLKKANHYLDTITDGNVEWDDLPDINSLHDANSIEEIEALCDERLYNTIPHLDIEDDEEENPYL